MEESKKRNIFDLPEDISLIEIIDEILKINGLEESTLEFFDKSIKNVEPRKIIVRDSAIALFEKRVPEDKLAEIMAEHLETSKKTAEKIIQEIKQKLTPYVKMVPVVEKEEEIKNTEIIEEPSTQDLLIEKIKQGIPDDENITEEVSQIPMQEIKKVEVEDVEENAKSLIDKRQTSKQGTVGGELQRKGQTDPYREAIG